MLSRLFKFLINNAKLTFCVSFLLCLILSFFAIKLSVDASAESLLLENDKDLKAFRELSRHYKSDNFLLLAFKPADENPFSNKNLKKLENLQKDLQSVFLVQRILSIINAPLLQSSNKDLKELIKDIPNIQSSGVDKNKAKEEITNSPFYQNNIISKDGKLTGLIIYLKTDEIYNDLVQKRDLAQDESEKNKFRLKLKKHQDEQKILVNQNLEQIKNIIKKYESDNDKFFLSGVSVIADDMITYVKSDLLFYGILLVLLLGFGLYYFFRSFYFVFLALFICFISLSAASGLFALLNFQITVISSNYVALVLIISLSVVVHLITHFINTRLKFPRSSIKKVVLQTLLAKANPSFFAIFTTMIGFFSLIFSNIEPIIKLGIMMSIGIALALVFAYVFLASILVLKEPKKIQRKDFNLKFLSTCANISLNRKKRLFIYFLCCFSVLLALFGISKLRVENSFVNYFKESSDIKKGLLVIDEKLGGTLPLEVVLKFQKPEISHSSDEFENEFESLATKDTYWFDSKKTRIAKKTHEFLENKEFVGSVLSLNSLLRLGKSINDGKDLDDFALAFLNENLPSEFKQDLLASFVSIENDELRFSMRIVDSNPKLRRNEFLLELKNELNELLKDENVSVQVSGIMLLYNNMLQSLFSSQFDTLVFVVLSIFVLFVIVFKSFKFALIAILANLIPLSLVFALMGILKIPLDLMSITIAAIAIGIGVDDALHYIHHFKKEIKAKSLEQAIINSHLNIGSALYYTSITIVLGFSVMLSSNFIPTIYFGVLTIFVMLLLLLGSLFLLPSFLFTSLKPFQDRQKEHK